MMIHCHILEDSDLGMMALFYINGEEGGSNTAARAADPTCYSPDFGARGGDWELSAASLYLPSYASIFASAVGAVWLTIFLLSCWRWLLYPYMKSDKTVPFTKGVDADLNAGLLNGEALVE